MLPVLDLSLSSWSEDLGARISHPPTLPYLCGQRLSAPRAAGLSLGFCGAPPLEACRQLTWALELVFTWLIKSPAWPACLPSLPELLAPCMTVPKMLNFDLTGSASGHVDTYAWPEKLMNLMSTVTIQLTLRGHQELTGTSAHRDQV